MMNEAITITGLQIKRNDSFTLHIREFKAAAKTIVCIAGPNGGGKSTLVQCIAGLLKPDRGTIVVDGQPVTRNLRAVKSIVGFIPDDENWLIPELCAKEYFELLARVYREAGVRTDIQAQVQGLANELSFTSFTQPMGSLSHGNKKKVQIIAGLMHEPKVVIVDELRNGLDPLAIMAAEKIIALQKNRGACILAATHDLWWAERTGDRILLLSDGMIKANLPIKTILRKHGSVEGLFIDCSESNK